MSDMDTINLAYAITDLSEYDTNEKTDILDQLDNSKFTVLYIFTIASFY